MILISIGSIIGLAGSLFGRKPSTPSGAGPVTPIQPPWPNLGFIGPPMTPGLRVILDATMTTATPAEAVKELTRQRDESTADPERHAMLVQAVQTAQRWSEIQPDKHLFIKMALESGDDLGHELFTQRGPQLYDEILGRSRQPSVGAILGQRAAASPDTFLPGGQNPFASQTFSRLSTTGPARDDILGQVRGLGRPSTAPPSRPNGVEGIGGRPNPFGLTRPGQPDRYNIEDFERRTAGAGPAPELPPSPGGFGEPPAVQPRPAPVPTPGPGPTPGPTPGPGQNPFATINQADVDALTQAQLQGRGVRATEIQRAINTKLGRGPRYTPAEWDALKQRVLSGTFNKADLTTLLGGSS